MSNFWGLALYSKNLSAFHVRVIARVMSNSLNSNYKSDDTTNNVLVNVLDNTSSGRTYSIIDSYWTAASNNTQSTKTLDINITRSFGSNTLDQGAGPFAILGTVMDAYDLLKKEEPNITFSKLNIYWSTSNRPTGGNISIGNIGTSYYGQDHIAAATNPNTTIRSLYILGNLGTDSDQYDTGVVAHEFGHYTEATIFRADNIGGSHTGSNNLDPRVAFGEGFGNAFGSIVRNDPIYFDSLGTNNTTGFFLNLESGSITNPGPTNEGSVQNIIWDLYDTASDGETVNLGFSAIYSVLRNEQKNTNYFTTIYSFVNGVKTRNPSLSSAIDTLVGKEFTCSINSDFGGTGGGCDQSTATSTPANCRSSHIRATVNQAAIPYTHSTQPIQLNFGGNGTNKYCATQYYALSSLTGSRTITITPAAGCDLDLYLYNRGTRIAFANAGGEGQTDTITTSNFSTLNMLEIRTWTISSSQTTGTCTYTLTIN